ncbi:MAG: hypothetical protein K0R17_3080 [Rariglobus sp.]|jgi:hypothetical protein|nr:hypothetical protein [Rariglobus sp.]
MKLNSTLFAALFVGAAAALSAAPLVETTPVYSKPESGAAAIGSLKAGSEPIIASGTTAPAGWTAVTLSGPHEVYAANKDVTKALEVRVGSPYLTDAKSGATVLTLAEKGDQTEIIDYRGKWTKFRLTKPVTGYIKLAAKSTPVLNAAPVTSVPVPAPAPAPVQPVTTVGKAAPVGDGASSALPRLFQGTFASTYNPLRPRRPYDFQLNDNAGSRYAYIDVSKLLATEQLNKYIDRTVVVYGTAQSVPGSKDMVVVAESLQLR